MGLFRRKTKLPEGTIERDDKLLIPAGELRNTEGLRAVQIYDEVAGETGPFICVNVDAVDDEIWAIVESGEVPVDEDGKLPREVVAEVFNNPDYWEGVDENVSEETRWSFFRFDPSTGRIAEGGGD